MSGLRSSNSVTNTVVDTLRIRGVTEPGLLITSSSGAVSVGTAPTLTNLAVTGTSMLGSAVVLGSLTSNSVNALGSLTTPTAFITNLDVSNATIANLDLPSASVSSLDVSNATITNGSITNLDVSNATIANLIVNPSLSVVDGAQSLTVTPTSLYSSETPFKIGARDFPDVLRVVDDGFTGYISVGDGSGARVYITGVGTEGQIQMNTGTGGVLNLGSSTFTNARAIVLSDNQVKINAPYSNPNLIKPAITVTDISVNIFTPGTSNPAISVDASGTTITYLDVSSATFKRLDASSALINTLTSTNATVSAGLFARYALIGDNTNTGDPSQNFVFIQAPAGQTFGRVRGSNLPTGSLELGAHANLTNIVLESSGVTVNAPSNPAITVSDISLNIFKPGTSNTEIRVDVNGTSIYTPLPPPIFSSVGGAPYMYYSSMGSTGIYTYNPIPQPPNLPSGVYYIMGVCATANNSEAKISTTAFYANGGVYNGWFAGGSALGPPLDSDTTYPGAQLKLRAKRDKTGLECIVLNAGSPAEINVQFIFIATYLFYPNTF